MKKLDGLVDIMHGFDHDAKEIDEVSRVSKAIYEKMWEHRWLQWTQFPKVFKKCKTEAELWQAIDNFNGWLHETGLGKKVFNKRQDKKEKEDDEPDNYGPVS